MIIQKMIKNAVKEKYAELSPKLSSNKQKSAVVFDLSKDSIKGIAIASRFEKEGLKTYFVSRRLCLEPNLTSLQLGEIDQDGVGKIFKSILDDDVAIDVVIVVGIQEEEESFLDIDVNDLYGAWKSNCLLHFYVAQSALESMLKYKVGTILFSGSSCSLQPQAKRAGEASNKAGVRMLAQSLARDFGPKGIHVAHIVDDSIEPDQSTNVFWNIYRQHKTAWTQEIICN